MFLSNHLSIYMFIYLSICLSIYLSIYLFSYLFIYLYVYLSIYPSIYLSRKEYIMTELLQTETKYVEDLQCVLFGYRYFLNMIFKVNVILMKFFV